MAVRTIRFDSSGLALEGRFAEPAGTPRGGWVLCHPHPLYEGSMSSALIPALQRSLEAAGFASLRFNFRGVGRSQGSYDRGEGETDDALGALSIVAAELPSGTPLHIAGWSFGSLVALRAAARQPEVDAIVAIAPPFAARPGVDRPDPPPPQDMRERRVLVIAGEFDNLAPIEAMKPWVDQAEARLEIVEGADHFFRDHEAVAKLILQFCPI